MGQVGSREAVRPPLSVWLRYRLLGVRVPREWLSWVEDDLSRPGWLRRQTLAHLVIVALFAVVLPMSVHLVGGGLSIGDFYGLFVLLALAGLQLSFADRLEHTRLFLGNRRMILRYQRGAQGDFMAPSKTTIPWMLAGLVIAAVIVLVVRALN